MRELVVLECRGDLTTEDSEFARSCFFEPPGPLCAPWFTDFPCQIRIRSISSSVNSSRPLAERAWDLVAHGFGGQHNVLYAAWKESICKHGNGG